MADKIFAVDYVDHNPSWKSGVENIKRSVNDWHAAFPDTHNSVEDVIVEGDKVAVRCTMRATLQGEFMGILPTGNLLR